MVIWRFIKIKEKAVKKMKPLLIPELFIETKKLFYLKRCQINFSAKE